MILVVDCFKLVKGFGKSIGIYNLTVNLLENLVKEQSKTSNDKIKSSKIIVLGNKYNRCDFDIKGVEFIEIKYNPMSKLRCIIWELALVSKICKKLNADRVLFPRGFSPLKNSVKDTIIVHDLIPFYYSKNYPDFFNKVENLYITQRLKASIKSCNQIITISNASKRDILDLVNIDKNKVKVIHNGYNLIKYKKEEIEVEPYIVAITSNMPHKNAEGIVRSYEEYCKISNKAIKLKIIGLENVESYNLTQDVKHRIKCYKYIKEDIELYTMISNAKVLLFLSLIEGFGFPPIEAMQLGVPVICSNQSSLPEVVSDAAILVNPNDYKEVSKSMKDLLNNEEKMETLISKGYENIKRFSWDSRSELYWSVLLDKK